MYEKQIGCYQTADSLNSLGFYVTKSDNRDPELHCRIWKFPIYSTVELEELATQLNEAIQIVKDRHMPDLVRKAKM